MNSTLLYTLDAANDALAGIPGLVTQAYQARLDGDAYGTDLFTLETQAKLGISRAA